jgi:hypothetical protein
VFSEQTIINETFFEVKSFFYDELFSGQHNKAFYSSNEYCCTASKLASDQHTLPP